MLTRFSRLLPPADDQAMPIVPVSVHHCLSNFTADELVLVRLLGPLKLGKRS